MNGRFLIHDGTTFGVAFSAEGDYGSSWGHSHDVSITTGVPSATVPNVDQGTPILVAATLDHTHTGTSTSGTTSWTIPSRAYVYMRKDAA